MENSPNQQKQKYWVGVLYPENMIDNWKEKIDSAVQIPFCYCVHDKCLTLDAEEERKEHVHLILAFPNTTTYKHAFSVFQRLSADGKLALNKIEAIVNIRWIYNYLIHDTESCRKQNKHLYDPKERISGNNFDIGAFEQISVSDKRRMAKELADFIKINGYTNFADFYFDVMETFSEEYFDIVLGYTQFFKSLIGGVYHRWQRLSSDKEYHDLVTAAKSPE